MRGRSDEVAAVQRGVDPKRDGNAPGVRGGEAERESGDPPASGDSERARAA